MIVSADNTVGVQVESHFEIDRKYYAPTEQEPVIGTIKGRLGEAEAFRVGIEGAALDGILPYDEFEGSTKRNRPALVVGDLVFCYVKSFVRSDIECVLSCLPQSQKSDGYGKLEGGLCVRVTPLYARSLFYGQLKQHALQNPLLTELGKEVAFECAVGFNGLVWIKSETVDNVVKITRLVRSCQKDSLKEIQAKVKREF